MGAVLRADVVEQSEVHRRERNRMLLAGIWRQVVKIILSARGYFSLGYVVMVTRVSCDVEPNPIWR